MDTLVSIELPRTRATAGSLSLMRSALDWFRAVEATCSRFDRESELARLCAEAGGPVPVSELLFRALEFALRVAETTRGAFDPTVGATMERLGFNRNYRTGRRTSLVNGAPGASYRDVVLDSEARTVTLRRPLLLDLGAVAKGLALDLAASALKEAGSFAVFAGGDLRLSGRNSEGHRWRIGLRHPRDPGAVSDVIELEDGAVCTSGDYERTGRQRSHHIVVPRTGISARRLASATVVAPSAMAADALATASFVLGPAGGLALLQREGAEGLLVTPALESVETPGFGRLR
jgi:thiamine biosynthesis lipoprotein